MSLQPETEKRTTNPKTPELKTGEITVLADEDRCVHGIGALLTPHVVCRCNVLCQIPLCLSLDLTCTELLYTTLTSWSCCADLGLLQASCAPH